MEFDFGQHEKEEETEGASTEEPPKGIGLTIADANLSHLPEWYTDEFRAMLTGTARRGKNNGARNRPHSWRSQSFLAAVQNRLWGRKLIMEHVENLLEKGCVEPARIERASSVVAVPTQDESLRFCADRQRFNALTIKDSYLCLNR